MAQGPRIEWVFGARLPWGGVWLNRHYVERELARDEHVVHVLDPLPARPSRRARSLATRDAERIGGDAAPEGIDTVRLPELPLQRLAPLAEATQRLGERRVRGALRGGSPVVVVQMPRARLFRPGALGEALTVYYCSDEFRVRDDGSTDETFCAWEDEMLARADLVVGVSPALCDVLARRHRHVRLVENGADPELFHPHDGPAPVDVADIPRPRLGFVGSVRRPLIDHDVVLGLARRRPGWSLCLVGWYDDDDPGIAAYRACGNVHVLGPRPREELSAYLGAMDVLICPHPPCEFADAASPLKGYEALAAGRPMVSLHAPALRGHAPHVRDTSSAEEFEAALADVLADPPAPDPALADSVSWAARARTFRAHVVEALRERES